LFLRDKYEFTKYLAAIEEESQRLDKLFNKAHAAEQKAMMEVVNDTGAGASVLDQRDEIIFAYVSRSYGRAL
jgi:hypothetical protein